MKTRALMSLAAVALSGFCGAASAGSPLKFSYFEADYIASEIKDGGQKGEGFRAALSRAIGPRSFFLAEYDSREYHDLGETYDFLSAGLGLKTNTRRVPSLAAFGAVTYERLDLDPDVGDKLTDEGYGVQVGLRGFFAELFEVSVSYKYLNYGDDSPFLADPGEDYDLDVARLGLVLPLSPGLSLTAQYQNVDDGQNELDEYLAGLRFSFGKGGLTERAGKPR